MIISTILTKPSKLMLGMLVIIVLACSTTSKNEAPDNIEPFYLIRIPNRDFSFVANIDCKEVIMSNSLYYLGNIFPSLKPYYVLDSFFNDYSVIADSTLVFKHPAAPPEGLLHVKRKYWLPDLDSSYFIFNTLTDLTSHESNYWLYEVNIVSSNVQFIDGIKIGIKRDDFKYIALSQGEISFHHIPDGYAEFSCDTITVRCDGLGDYNFYIFNADTLKEILFFDHNF
jgi:hypothetical protein